MNVLSMVAVLIQNSISLANKILVFEIMYSLRDGLTGAMLARLYLHMHLPRVGLDTLKASRLA